MTALRYDLALITASGRRLLVPSSRATAVVCSTGPRGFQDLSATIPMSDAQAQATAEAPGLRARLGWAGGVIWEGRVEDITLGNGEVTIGALGDARAMDDTRYTELWSDSNVGAWVPTRTELIAGRVPERWEIDTNNRLYLAPRKGETYPQYGGIGSMYYETPSQSTRLIVGLTASYAVLLPSGWEVSINRMSGFGGAVTVWSLAATGLAQTGTISVTFTGMPQLEYFALKTSAGSATLATDTGTYYARLTDVRVRSTTAATVTANAIVADIIAQANTVNAGALSTSQRMIASPGLDLRQEVYEDMAPSAVLDRLAAYGDSSGNPYIWGCWEGRELFFRPRGTGGRAWACDAGALSVTQRLDGLINSTYATYQEAAGRTLRTAAQTNAASIQRYGRTRQGVVPADTTSPTTAATVAATATAATATPVPTATIQIRRFSTLSGAPARGEWVRAGDTITIRNLDPSGVAAIDRIRTFRVAQTRYDVIADTVEITPEAPAPDLEFQIALVLAQTKR